MHNKNLIKSDRNRKSYSRRSTAAKKVILVGTMVMVMAAMGCLTAAADTTDYSISVSDFAGEAKTAIVTVVSLIGAGLGIWGVVNLLEGYGNDNPGAKSQGLKQLMAGVGLVVLANVLIPTLFSTMTTT